jgi:hypothetical protein
MEIQHTYLLNRRCKYCQEPISDQEHGAREFCETTYLEDGTRLDCKDRYNAPAWHAEFAPFKALGMFHRDTLREIKTLLTEVGEVVSVKDLNAKGIQLHRALKREQDNQGLYTFYFMFFCFQQISYHQFKIVSHEIF